MISTDACPRLRPQTRLSIFDELRRRARRVAIGNFDGVHLGHRQVIGDHDTILTFDPHPLTVVGQVPARAASPSKSTRYVAEMQKHSPRSANDSGLNGIWVRTSGRWAKC